MTTATTQHLEEGQQQLDAMLKSAEVELETAQDEHLAATLRLMEAERQYQNVKWLRGQLGKGTP